MERIPSRQLPRCKDLRMDISTGVADWQIRPPLPAGSQLAVGPAPISLFPHADWASSPNTNVNWVGSRGDLLAVQGIYRYELTFCLCWTFRHASLDFNLWADNSAIVYLNDNPVSGGAVPNPAFHNLPLHPILITTGFQVGMNTLRIDVTNDPPPANPRCNPTGLMISGLLSADAADCTT